MIFATVPTCWASRYLFNRKEQLTYDLALANNLPIYSLHFDLHPAVSIRLDITGHW